MSFNFNILSEPLVKAIEELGYETPTEIQEKAIPLLLSGHLDFVGQAQTGTGKTAAFCLPLLEHIDTRLKGIQAIILSPTRELANQINNELIKFTRYLDIKTMTVYGGVGYREQINGLRDAHIVIATPGRAIDLLNKGKLKVETCQYFVIDEADEMLKMGFIEDVGQLMESVSEDACKWMFSATIPRPIVKLMEEKLDSPEIVKIKKDTLSNKNITQSFCQLHRKDFTKALRAVLLTEENFFGIVFCETKDETKALSEKLISLGKKVATLHGDLNQNQRDIAIGQFRRKKVDILVCTDVAARGLDISEVTHVINMGLPRKADSYVHRIGRTGRAGQVGKAISFIGPNDTRSLKIVERLTKQKMSRYELPTPQESKRKKVTSELSKMDLLKSAIQKKGSDFVIDESFTMFEDYLNDLSKEDMSKLLFSYMFNGELRLIDESLDNLKASLVNKPERGGRRERKGPRNRNRSRSNSRSGSRSNSRSGQRKDSNRQR